MSIHATITVDDDRWARFPFGVEFDDEECNKKFGQNRLSERTTCYKIIEKAKEAGYDIDDDVDERFY